MTTEANPRPSGNKAHRFAIFPSIWLLSLAGVCVANVAVNIAALASFVIGTITYAATTRYQKERATLLRQQTTEGGSADHEPPALAPRLPEIKPSAGRGAVHIIAIFLILAISLLVTRVYYWITWNPVGDPYDNGWGKLPLPDISDTYPPVANSNRILATTRRLRAGLLIADSPIEYFLFVHSANQPADHSNLVFRYFTTDSGWNNPPRVTWTSSKSLLVRTGEGDVLQITKQVHFIDGITIRYLVPSMANPPALNFWERPLF